MVTLLTILLIATCFVVIIAVLLQPAKGGTTTAFGGSSQSLFGSTGATTFLFKAALWGGMLIMVICLSLSVLRVRETKKSVIDLSAPIAVPGGVPETAPANPAPAAPATAPTK